MVYHPGGSKGRGVPVANAPPPIPQGRNLTATSTRVPTVLINDIQHHCCSEVE